MTKLSSIRYTKETEEVLSELEEKLGDKILQVEKDKVTRNKLVNTLLRDFSKAILEVHEVEPKVSYERLLHSLVAYRGDDRLDRLIKHEIKVNDRLNELLYIQLYANHQLMINDDYMDNAKSMYKRGTPIFYIRQKARDLVEQDNMEMFGRLQKKYKSDSSY